MQCDMCGKESSLSSALIEGTKLSVCQNCSRYGNVIEENKKRVIFKPILKETVKKQILNKQEFYLSVVENYAQKIRQKRELLRITQEDFARNINERLSLMQKVESNNFMPNLELARKLEKYLNIILVEQKIDEEVSFKKSSNDVLTIGDLIKF